MDKINDGLTHAKHHPMNAGNDNTNKKVIGYPPIEEPDSISLILSSEDENRDCAHEVPRSLNIYGSKKVEARNYLLFGSMVYIEHHGEHFGSPIKTRHASSLIHNANSNTTRRKGKYA